MRERERERKDLKKNPKNKPNSNKREWEKKNHSYREEKGRARRLKGVEKERQW